MSCTTKRILFISISAFAAIFGFVINLLCFLDPAATRGDAEILKRTAETTGQTAAHAAVEATEAKLSAAAAKRAADEAQKAVAETKDEVTAARNDVRETKGEVVGTRQDVERARQIVDRGQRLIEQGTVAMKDASQSLKDLAVLPKLKAILIQLTESDRRGDAEYIPPRVSPQFLQGSQRIIQREARREMLSALLQRKLYFYRQAQEQIRDRRAEIYDRFAQLVVVSERRTLWVPVLEDYYAAETRRIDDHFHSRNFREASRCCEELRLRLKRDVCRRNIRVTGNEHADATHQLATLKELCVRARDPFRRVAGNGALAAN